MKCITVSASSGYDVLVGRGLLQDAGRIIRAVINAPLAVLVSDSTVDALCGNKAAESLAAAGIRVLRYVFPAGEASKNTAEYVKMLEFLAENGVDRSSVIVALGGGVTGDLAGFAAATYLRGIAVVQIPTTVLACVDSSVGGKTAVDLAAGKNLVGAFCQPRAVICDPDLLDTLPDEIFLDGCAEIIKYGMICDRELLNLLNGPDFDREEIIARCVAIKRDIVCRDEFDNGDRQLLNFGHTLGHAIEKLSDYKISHGRAVAIGMAVMTRACAKLGICSSGDAELLLHKLETFGLPTGCDYAPEDIAAAAAGDKKRRGNTVTLVVPKSAGNCILNPVPVEKLEEYARLGLGGAL
ncbi:MAG: 3-dehydroquinate synthase [Clostridia bacterium]|nr:3-dehydroquinate synthase [Clostridia bacterium]